MNKAIVSLTLAVLLFFFSIRLAVAENEFVSTYNVFYEVKESGITHVTQNISISNTTSNYYVSEYSLTISSTKIHNVYAQDGEGPLKTRVTQTENATEIKAEFNQKVAGLGKTLNFLLSYDSDDIASHNGKIWEVNIPKLAKSDQITGYAITLKVPPAFGKPTYIYPHIESQALIFSKDQLEKSGITLTFGSYQVFQYQLKYHLSNTRNVKVFTEIAIPPQTQYQEIRLDDLSPKPTSVRTDEDGNWLAKYILNPQEAVTVTASGSAKLFLFPQKGTTLSNSMKEKYLRPQKFWESNNPKIVELANSLKTPKAIYDFVVKTLTYDYKRLDTNTERFGASKILTMPTNAICMEFTDLFIAISRAAGTPARELNGFAYTTNEKLRPLSLVTDVLHSWPEYWDETRKAWIPVDPTWENTTSGVDYFNKLDFNHFVFVIKGVDSETPYPAGSYKQDREKKDVIIDFGEDWVFQPSTPEIKLEMPQKTMAGMRIDGTITLVNNGKTLSDEGTLKITSSPLNLLSVEKTKIASLPPFGQFDVTLQIDNSKFLYSGANTVSTSFQGKTIAKTMTVTSFLPNFLLFLGSILILTFGIIGVTFLIFKKVTSSKNG